MVLLPPAPQAGASASSATSALGGDENNKVYPIDACAILHHAPVRAEIVLS